ncbi:MAG: hypothetical protein N3F10_02125 [Candidatus Bathyarchaeota archaeon]|nr:hypothetical protein [Candidatus Bathyarchaeota archaeon]MCX8177081.1 hypothetical protein [Candidatus Bathyarchaeota archaeon]MDW8194181.1 archaellin/type IV pilin N-terminal domain-containing protein [Nitrososphaerota archaeon]
MKTAKMSQSEKAISPILATLLLVVIAVAAIVVTYAWIMTYMSSAGEQAGIMLTKDAVYWADQSSITIYVRNTGTSDAYINAVYIGTSPSNLTKIEDVTFGDGVGAVPADGGVTEITVDGFTWSAGAKYYFRIVPKTGAPLEFSERAPSTGP